MKEWTVQVETSCTGGEGQHFVGIFPERHLAEEYAKRLKGVRCQVVAVGPEVRKIKRLPLEERML